MCHDVGVQEGTADSDKESKMFHFNFLLNIILTVVWSLTRQNLRDT